MTASSVSSTKAAMASTTKAGPAAAACLPCLVTGRPPAERTSAPIVVMIMVPASVVSISVIVTAVIAAVIGPVITRVPVVARTSSPSTVVVTARRQGCEEDHSCEEQRSEDRYFPAADRFHFHFGFTRLPRGIFLSLQNRAYHPHFDIARSEARHILSSSERAKFPAVKEFPLQSSSRPLYIRLSYGISSDGWTRMAARRRRLV